MTLAAPLVRPSDTPTAPLAPIGRLSPHLRRLEAEAIEIFREVAATARNPVMLYSIGKDSGVLLHLAAKAFYPAPPPFPLLHVDTTWKFRDMIRHRDTVAETYGARLIVHINQDGVKRGVSPVASGSSLHTRVMKTDALKQALDQHGFDVAFGGARRDEEKSSRQGTHLLGARPRPHLGSASSETRALEAMELSPPARRIPAGLPPVELDRARRLGIHADRGHPGRAALFFRPTAGRRARRRVDRARR